MLIFINFYFIKQPNDSHLYFVLNILSSLLLYFFLIVRLTWLRNWPRQNMSGQSKEPVSLPLGARHQASVCSGTNMNFRIEGASFIHLNIHLI